MTTIYCKVLEIVHDPFGYVDYVVESLDKTQEKLLVTKYLIVTKFPNWDHRELSKGETGFLKYKEITPGVDQWFDGKDMNYYKSFEGWQFMKFIGKTPEVDQELILD